MACRLFCAKPLTKPMVINCQLDSWKQTLNQTFIIFIKEENAFENVVCQNGGHVVRGVGGGVGGGGGWGWWVVGVGGGVGAIWSLLALGRIATILKVKCNK